MRKVKLNTTVIRGILALAKPGMAYARRNELPPEELKKLSIYKSDMDAANQALDWAASVHASLKAPPPEPKPSYNDLVIPDFD